MNHKMTLFFVMGCIGISAMISGMELVRSIPNGNVYISGNDDQEEPYYWRIRENGAFYHDDMFERKENSEAYGSMLVLDKKNAFIKVIGKFGACLSKMTAFNEDQIVFLPIALTDKQIDEIKYYTKKITQHPKCGRKVTITSKDDILAVDNWGDVYKLIAVEKATQPITPSISHNVFIWSYVDCKYHKITEQGAMIADFLPNNDQPRMYNAQLVIEDDKCSLRTTQECVYQRSGPVFRNLEKHERSLMPITLSAGQIDLIYKSIKCRSKKEEPVIIVDAHNNEYCIKHVYDADVDDSPVSQRSKKRDLIQEVDDLKRQVKFLQLETAVNTTQNTKQYFL